MPEIADPPAVCCFSLHSGSGIEENQILDPDLFPVRAHARDGNGRDPSGRFANGHSGNPQGRLRGIPNPKRLVLTLQAYRRNPQGVLALVKRKRWLLRPLCAQVLPPASARRIDPGAWLGISIASLSHAADFRQALQRVWNGVVAGEIGPHEAGRLARRIRARMRALRRLARFQRRLARLENNRSGLAAGRLR